jgi:carboxymethylenebutenolidase
MRRRIRGILALFVLSFAAILHAAENRPDEPNTSGRVIDRKGEQTTLKTAADKPLTAYIIGPKEATRGVLVISASVGLDDQTRDWADRLAANGYRAIAVDVGGGDSPKVLGPIRTLDQNDVNAKYRAALEALREPGRTLAVIGWCAGGDQALEATLAAPDLVSATAVYYGSPSADASRLMRLRAPVLLVVAKDEAGAGRLKTFEAAMRQAKKVLDLRTVGAASPCANPKEMSYERESSRAAWQAVSDFLNRYLR